jgi:hypothetical protein
MTKEEQAIVYFKDMRKRMCEDHLEICPKDSVAYRATLLRDSYEKDNYHDEADALTTALEIFDKYKTESEEGTADGKTSICRS